MCLKLFEFALSNVDEYFMDFCVWAVHLSELVFATMKIISLMLSVSYIMSFYVLQRKSIKSDSKDARKNIEKMVE